MKADSIEELTTRAIDSLLAAFNSLSPEDKEKTAKPIFDAIYALAPICGREQMWRKTKKAIVKALLELKGR